MQGFRGQSRGTRGAERAPGDRAVHPLHGAGDAARGVAQKPRRTTELVGRRPAHPTPYVSCARKATMATLVASSATKEAMV